MTFETGLRERKKAATRASLATAALELGVERGIEHLTVEDIAEAAGVSTRTFFNYFPTKEAAFVADDVDRGRDFVRSVAAQGDEMAPWQALRTAAVSALGRSELPERELALKIRLSRMSPAVVAEQLAQFERLEHELVDEVARRCGLAATDLLPRLMTAAVTAAFRATVETWLTAGSSDDFTNVLERALDALSPSFDHVPGRPARS
jgi:AcrR family transcriptional regulator